MGKLTEDFFRKIVDNTGDIVWVVSSDQNTIEFVNRDFSGVKRQHILEKGMTAIWPVVKIESLEPLLEAFRAAAMDGRAFEDIRTVHRNATSGEEEHYLHSVMPVRSTEGTVSRIQVVSTDVTPLMRTQRLVEILNSVSTEVQQKMLSRDLFRAVGERLKKYDISIIVLITEDGKTARLVYSSLPKRKLRKGLSLIGKEKVYTGIPVDQWRGVMRTIRHRRAQFWDDPHAFVHSRLHDKRFKKNIDSLIELFSLKRIIVTPMVAGKDTVGSLVMLSDTLTKMDLEAVKTFAAQFSHVLVNARMHRDAQRMLEYLHKIRENLNEGIFVVDERGVIVSWNRAARDLLGYEREDIIGTGIVAMGIEKSEWERLEEKALSGDGARRERVLLRAKSGTWKQFSLSAFATESRRSARAGFTCTIREAAQ
jgi:PAS domain S-box-containing protein